MMPCPTCFCCTDLPPFAFAAFLHLVRCGALVACCAPFTARPCSLTKVTVSLVPTSRIYPTSASGSSAFTGAAAAVADCGAAAAAPARRCRRRTLAGARAASSVDNGRFSGPCRQECAVLRGQTCPSRAQSRRGDPAQTGASAGLGALLKWSSAPRGVNAPLHGQRQARSSAVSARSASPVPRHVFLLHLLRRGAPTLVSGRLPRLSGAAPRRRRRRRRRRRWRPPRQVLWLWPHTGHGGAAVRPAALRL